VKRFLGRYRWWLLMLIAVAGLASWFLWPNAAERAMRERYDRILIDMTQAEVTEIMKPCSPMTPTEIFWSIAESLKADTQWKSVARSEHRARFARMAAYHGDYGLRCWGDNYTRIWVDHQHGKAAAKFMFVRMTPLEMKLRDRLGRLGFSIP
jgi:hypothetical protein